MQLFFKGHFQLIAFQKLKDCKLEKFCMKDPRPPPKISLRHDHNWTRGNDQLGSTVEQQPVGKLVQQSFGEAPRVKLSNPNPIQSVIDRGNLRTQNVFLWIKEKRPVHTRSMINVCTKNLALQIDR